MAETVLLSMAHGSKSKQNGKEFREIVKDVSLSVNTHDFVCIMGPTGCGKSTLMQMLSGVDACDSGTYQFQNQDVTRGMKKNLLRNIGVVFQSDNLFEWRSVYRNVREPIEVFGLKKTMDVEARILAMLELTGLKNYRDCLPKELSGGMRQRCSIARALAHDPKTLFLDQPFGALDAITRKALGWELLKIWKESQKTVVMVTNNVTEALTLATKVVILSKAPATVSQVVEIPFTYEERTQNLMEHPQYLELREKLDALVHTQKS